MSTQEPLPSCQVPLEDMLRACQAISRTAAASSQSATQAKLAVEDNVTATCIQCQMTLTGTEISQLALADSATPLVDNPKLERLRLGYCGRSSCESKFYQVQCRSSDLLDPAVILAAVQSIRSEDLAVAQPKRASFSWSHIREHPTARRIALGVGVFLLLLLLRHLWLGGTIPLLHKDPGYTLDPNSQRVAPANP